MNSPFTLARILATLICLVVTAGCHSFRAPGGILEQQSTRTGMTSSHLQSIMDDLVLQYASRVELAADRIMAETDSPQVRRNALLWKSNGIGACFQGATRRDPLAAFLNIWILNKQTLQLFQEEELFGSSRELAIRTCIDLEDSFSQVLDQIGKEFPIGESFATRFAADYPVRNLYFDRASISEHYTEYIEKITVRGRDLQQIMSELDSQIDQFQKMSAMYAEFLPKQARWQAELLMLDATGGSGFRIAINSVKSATRSLESVTRTAAQVASRIDTVPDLVAREREILRRTMAEEREAAFRSLDELQDRTMLQLANERIAVLDQLEKEREAILDRFEQERIATTADLARFGQRLFGQVDTAADRKIETIAARSLTMADHVLWRMTGLGLLGFSILLVCWRFRRRLEGSPPRVHRPWVDPGETAGEPDLPRRPAPNRDRWRRAA